MDIVKICGAIVLCWILVTLLKQYNAKIATLTSVLTVIIITTQIISALNPIIILSQSLSSYIKTENNIPRTLLKACGIHLLSHTVSTLCAESGDKTLSDILEKATDVSVLLLALPMLESSFDSILKILNNI